MVLLLLFWVQEVALRELLVVALLWERILQGLPKE